MADNQLFSVGQKAFIEKDGMVLLMVDPIYGLDLPGGRIQVDERNLHDALQRELLEETQLEVTVGRPIVTWMWHVATEDRVGFLVGYQCTYISGDVVLSDEHSEFHWVTKESVEPLLQKYEKENPELCDAIRTYFRTKTA